MSNASPLTSSSTAASRTAVIERLPAGVSEATDSEMAAAATAAAVAVADAEGSSLDVGDEPGQNKDATASEIGHSPQKKQDVPSASLEVPKGGPIYTHTQWCALRGMGVVLSARPHLQRRFGPRPTGGAFRSL